MTHRLEPGGSGPEATRTCLLHDGGGELPGRSANGWEGRGDVLRGSHGDVAGAESGASSAERSTGEHGNHPWSARGSRRQRGRSGWVHRRPSGPGWGGAVVVVAGVTTCHGARESRTQDEGRQQESRSEDAAMPKDALANVGAHHRVPIGPRRRVSEMQANLHRCAFVHDGRPCGEPGAVRVARRVRRAAWGNGPAAMPAPRPRPTQPNRPTSGAAGGALLAAVGATLRLLSATRVLWFA